MFKSARLKLTAWYLGIIMLITLAFSGFVFAGVNRNTQRALEGSRRRLERDFRQVPEQRGFDRPAPMVDPDTLLEIREQTLIDLLAVNLVVLVIAGAAGYFLAGRTLDPIELMVQKQKRFVSDAAHELRTPLTAMKTDLEVTLREKNLTVETSRKSLKGTIDEVNKLQTLTDKLLAQSKYQNGQNFKLENLQLEKIIEEVVRKLASLASNNNETINVSLNKAKIFGNEEKLRELFTNLIENAIKYNAHGGIVTISTTVTNDSTITTIEDQGQGIAKVDLPYIFEPFYRADKSRTDSAHYGYGLGLAISKEIVEDHHGKITVESEVNKGTKFTVSLPLSKFSEKGSSV